MRKAAGKPPLEMPREAAGYRVMHDGSWEWVTWKEIHGNRAKAQRERLERLRRPEEVWPRRAQLWVFFNDGFIYGGWHVYVRYWSMVSHREEWAGGGYKGGWGERGIDSLMEKIPLDLASAEGWLFPPEGWVLRREWCEAFAAAYPKRPAGEDTRKAGLLNGWTDGHDFFLTREEAMGKEAAA